MINSNRIGKIRQRSLLLEIRLNASARFGYDRLRSTFVAITDRVLLVYSYIAKNTIEINEFFSTKILKDIKIRYLYDHCQKIVFVTALWKRVDDKNIC